MKKTKRLAGARAKHEGQLFEARFKHLSWVSGWHCEQIPSGCKWLGKNRIVGVPTPFDFLLCKAGRVIFCDVKSINDDKFSYSKLERHQVKSLSMIGEQTLPAGYIINFRPIGSYYFFSWDQLAGLKPRESLKPVYGICVGDDNGLTLGNIFHESSSENQTII